MTAQIYLTLECQNNMLTKKICLEEKKTLFLYIILHLFNKVFLYTVKETIYIIQMIWSPIL